MIRGVVIIATKQLVLVHVVAAAALVFVFRFLLWCQDRSIFIYGYSAGPTACDSHRQGEQTQCENNFSQLHFFLRQLFGGISKRGTTPRKDGALRYDHQWKGGCKYTGV